MKTRADEEKSEGTEIEVQVGIIRGPQSKQRACCISVSSAYRNNVSASVMWTRSPLGSSENANEEGEGERKCRAARAFLGWNQKELAERAGVGIVAVNQFETGISEPRRATLDVVRRAFERAGVVFIDENGGGPGLRLKRRKRK